MVNLQKSAAQYMHARGKGDVICSLFGSNFIVSDLLANTPEEDRRQLGKLRVLPVTKLTTRCVRFDTTSLFNPLRHHLDVVGNGNALAGLRIQLAIGNNRYCTVKEYLEWEPEERSKIPSRVLIAASRYAVLVELRVWTTVKRKTQRKRTWRLIGRI